MFSKASLLFLLASILTMSTSSPGTFCTYYRNSNNITCGSVTCTTVSPSNNAHKLPFGYYFIGNYPTCSRYPVMWFNLYRQRHGGGFWDYDTYIPELGCRRYRFCLNFGSVSEGCVTVTDLSCFTQLRNEINRHYCETDFNAYKCHGCYRWWGCLRIRTVKRVGTGDLWSVGYEWTFRNTLNFI